MRVGKHFPISSFRIESSPLFPDDDVCWNQKDATLISKIMDHHPTRKADSLDQRHCLDLKSDFIIRTNTNCFYHQKQAEVLKENRYVDKPKLHNMHVSNVFPKENDISLKATELKIIWRTQQLASAAATYVLAYLKQAAKAR